MLLIFHNLYRLALWLNIWSIFVSGPFVFENNAHFAVVECSSLYVSFRSNSWLCYSNLNPYWYFAGLFYYIPLIVYLPFYFSNFFSLKYYKTMLLDTFMFSIVIYSEWIKYFIIFRCLFFYFIFLPKVYFDISIAISILFWFLFTWSIFSIHLFPISLYPCVLDVSILHCT